MPAPSKALAWAAAISGVSAFRGFNYGNKFTTGALKQQADYEAEFKAARELPGTNGAFDSARLYTMIVLTSSFFFPRMYELASCLPISFFFPFCSKARLAPIPTPPSPPPSRPRRAFSSASGPRLVMKPSTTSSGRCR